MEITEEMRNRLKINCAEQAFETYGTEYIFNKRARRYSKYVNLLKVFGIGVPGVIGFCYIAHEYFVTILDPLRYIAIILLGIQFIFSIFSVIYKWDDELAYSYEASQAYNYLYDKFTNLEKSPLPLTEIEYKEFSNKYELLLRDFVARNQQDNKHNLKEWELRMGYRYSLRQHKLKCKGIGKCTETPPSSMESTNCPVCGRFSFKYKLLNA